jgi:hypothetical protein
MHPTLTRIKSFLALRLVHLVRLAGLSSVTSGLIGGYVWFVDLADRSDGDGLRWGFWHNPFMQFPPFDEGFLDISMHVLSVCSAAAGLGGLMLLIPWRWGVPLVTWQARVSIITNGVIAFFIVAAMFVFAKHQWDQWHLGGSSTALVLRLASIAVDLVLWAFLSSDAVREFWRWHAHPPDRAFDVIINKSSGAVPDRTYDHGRPRAATRVSGGAAAESSPRGERMMHSLGALNLLGGMGEYSRPWAILDVRLRA